MQKTVIDKTTIEALKGDITTVKTDAIVNAANSDLWMGTGVAGTILRKGGRIIEEEAMTQGPIHPGEAVITSAGNLHFRYVIHCAGMPPGGAATKEYVTSSVANGLILAENKKVSSIAIPAIGAGVGGLTYEESWNSIINGIKIALEKRKSFTKILLVAYGEESYDILQKIIDDLNRIKI